MTKVIFNFDGETIFFECVNHSGNHDVCTIVSTLCNVLIKAMEMWSKPVAVQEDGHVRITVADADELLTNIFRTVQNTFYEVEDQYPFFIKAY